MQTEAPFTSVDPRVSSVSGFQVFLLLVNVGIGAYIAVAPLAWYYQGLVLGSMTQLIGTLLVLQGASSFVRISNEFKAYSAEDMAKLVLGKTWFAAMIAIQMIGSIAFSIATLYLSATTLMGIFQRVVQYDTLTPATFQAFCVIFISALILPFVLKREVKGLHAAALIMFVSLILFMALVVYFFITNYHDV